jgi:hypothetical protein
MKLPDNIIAAISYILSLGAALFFAALSIKILIDTWRNRPPPSTNVVYVATTLGGLVGGVVAAAFGQALPKPPTGGVVNGAFTSFVSNAGRWLAADKELLGMAYIGLYFVVGFAAGVTWLFSKSPVPDVVRNQAMVTFGLVIAIVSAFMRTT